MRQYLSIDEASGELRLVMTDTYNGQHERTEFRVTDDYGKLVRGPSVAHLDGKSVHGSALSGSFYVIRSADGGRSHFSTEHTAVGPTVKTPCPKEESRRRKCALCA